MWMYRAKQETLHKMFPLFLLLLFVFGIDAEMAIKFAEGNVHHKYIKAIYKKYLGPKEINFCVDCHKLRNYVPEGIPLVTTNRKTKKLHWYQDIKIDSYIVDLSREVENVLDFVEEMPGWNPRAKFFIIFKKGSMSYLLKQLFSKYITNVAIFTPVNSTTLKVSTYFPFDKGRLRPKSIKSTTIATLSDENFINDTIIAIDLFSKPKRPSKWKNATINVIPAFVAPYIMCPTCPKMRGLEFLLLRSVGEKLGVEFKYPDYVCHTWGHKTPNGSYTMGLGAVQERKFDLAVGGYHANTPENVDFDMIYPHMEDNMVVVVHSANIEARWKGIINIFQSSVWIPFSVVIFTMPIIFFVFSLFKNKLEFSFSILISLSIMLKITLAKMAMSRAQRVLLTFWIFYSLLTDIYFESHLLGALNKAHRGVEINSIEKIVDMGFKVIIHKKHVKAFPDINHKIDRYIQENSNRTNLNLEASNASALDQKTAAIVMDRFIKFYIPRMYMDPEDGTSMLHILKEKLMFVSMTMYFSKGFPLYDEINNLIHEMKSKGLINKLYRYATYKNLVSFYSVKSFIWRSDSLKLTEMKYLFWMLLIGLFCASVVFVCELLWYKIK